MAIALRVRVFWDETIIDDRLHFGRRVRIGAGEKAQVAAPDAPERFSKYVVLTWRGRTLELAVEPGAADSVEFPGEEPIAVEGQPFSRLMRPPFGSGVIKIGSARIEFERILIAKEARDRVLWAWSAAAVMLALLGGGSYRLARAIGDGDTPQWGTPPKLSERDVRGVRVKLGPDGLGAMRPQAGSGTALAGKAKAPVKRTVEAAPKTTAPRVARAKPKFPRANAPIVIESKIQTPVASPPVDRGKQVEAAQAALLKADLRAAIDGFSKAATVGPLDYDQLNWLGLAHYLQSDLDEAERVWADARSRDPLRADAINNLAAVAKRRGDTAHEIELLNAALALDPNDCHASNSLALAQARLGNMSAATATLERSDAACGGGYAYTAIQKAAILSLRGEPNDALSELEKGLAHVDTLVPIKEFEVWSDLRLDPAFASIRGEARFRTLVAKYLPRANGWL
jgi:Flp pilus assembly protein TadD